MPLALLLPFLVLLAALVLLVVLTVIDLRVRLLPNIYVFPFAALGIVFHGLYHFEILSPGEMLIGGLTGYGLLWIIRFGANRHYGYDSLGLGDVKLMGGAGLWLGMDGVLFALTLGAFMGVLHGILHACFIAWREKTRPSLRGLMIPAGPGFIVGIIAVGIWMFYPHMMEWLHVIGA